MTKVLGHPASLTALLMDPDRLTVSITEAADILGISRSTAFYAANNSGCITAGVPVIRITTKSHRERRVISTAHLRNVLGMDLPS